MSGLVPCQVYNTPESHVTRDYREGVGNLADLQFKMVDTSGEQLGWPKYVALAVNVIGWISMSLFCNQSRDSNLI
jgi:hypothetical protein